MQSDLVTSFEVLEHTYRIRGQVEAYNKLLRTGGALCLTDPDRFWRNKDSDIRLWKYQFGAIMAGNFPRAVNRMIINRHLDNYNKEFLKRPIGFKRKVVKFGQLLRLIMRNPKIISKLL
jgi:hypothetical protein